MSESHGLKVETQKMSDGYGSAYHRVYSIRLPLSMPEARQAMRDLQRDLNRFSPQLLARFEKRHGAAEILQTDDEFQIHITGPWNGPVRVAGVSADEFRLITLEGHLEAGEIRFRVRKASDSETVFEIESLARSRDAVVDLVYDKIPIAKLVQTEMWKEFCQNFAAHATKNVAAVEVQVGEVEILTERRDEESAQWKKQ